MIGITPYREQGLKDPLLGEVMRSLGMDSVPLYDSEAPEKTANKEYIRSLGKTRDGPVSPERVDVSDSHALTERVKGMARDLGADIVGVAMLQPLFIDDGVDLPHDVILCMGVYQDASGALWIGTTGGLGRVMASGGRFGRITASPNDPRGLSDGKITTMFEDRTGSVWVATEAGGLNRSSDPRQGFLHYRGPLNRPAVLSGEEIYAMAQAPDGGVWVGVYGVGVEHLDPQTGRVTERYRPDPSDPTSLVDACIRGVFGAQNSALRPQRPHHHLADQEVLRAFQHVRDDFRDFLRTHLVLAGAGAAG